MTLSEAQKDMRAGLMGGFMGQMVSGVLWLGSAVLATLGYQRSAMGFLVVGGFFIFPLTLLGLRAIGHRATVAKDNPLNRLGMEAAFVLPLCLPLVGAATLYRLEWFYPAFMILVGAHYLPYATVYGMRMFYVLAGVLFTVGLVTGLWMHLPFGTGGWISAVVLFVFAFWGRMIAMRESGAGSTPPDTRP